MMTMIINKNVTIFPKRFYGIESIVNGKNGPELVVQLNKIFFHWSLRNIGKKGNDVWIAYFNPNPAVDYELYEAMAQELAELFVHLQARVVVAPSSHKSEDGIRKAINIASEKMGFCIAFINLLGTKRTTEGRIIISEEVLRRESSEEFIVPYEPITSQGKPKLLGISSQSAELLRKYYRDYCQDEQGLVLTDDAYTTGATIRATQSVVNKVLGLPANQKHRIAALAEEVIWGTDYFTKPSPQNLVAVIRIPEIVGDLYLMGTREFGQRQKPPQPPRNGV